MTDSWEKKPESGPAGPRGEGPAPSPFDNPTERITEPASTHAEPVVGPASFLDEPHAEESDDTRPTYSFASIPPSTSVAGRAPKSRPGRGYDASYGRGTIDLGLLILRLAIGGTFVYTGLMKLTHLWGSHGFQGTKDGFAHSGWKHPALSAALAAAGELGGGALLVLGLVTPLAAGAIVGVAVNAWTSLQDDQHGIAFNMASGTILIAVLGAAAAGLVLTGPGRYSLDRDRRWATSPGVWSFLILVAAIVAGVITWIVLRGTNPFHF